jgi:hypothetical protein
MGWVLDGGVRDEGRQIRYRPPLRLHCRHATTS